MTARPARRPTGDAGATLVLVLVFVASFGLIVPALLTLSQTSVGSIAFTRQAAETSTDAENAAEEAVHRLRTGTFYNAPSQPCFHDPADTTGATDSNALVTTGANTGRQVLVTCQGRDATGYPTSIRVPVTTANRPGQALLTLATGAERGLVQTANNTLRVQGKVFSHSGITVENPNARLEVQDASLTARGDCDGTITGNPKSCNDTGALPPDPGYVLPLPVPAPRTVPACSGSSPALELQPGTYTDAAALSELTKNSCKALLRFTPGVYHFDFAASAPVWSITDGYVIGGTAPSSGPRAWSASAYPGVKPRVPGACVTPTEGSSAPNGNGGVLFIFGGESRMAISGGGKVELCGRYSDTEPPHAIFGANVGSSTGPTTSTVKYDGTQGPNDFQDPARIKDHGEVNGTSTAYVVANNTNPATGTVTVKMPATPGVPAGSVLTSATLRVWHQEQVGPAKTSNPVAPAGPVTGLTVSVKPYRFGSGSAPVLSPASQPVVRSTLGQDALDLTSALKPYFDAHGFTGVDTTYSAAVGANTAATAALDSIQLELVYEVPGYKASSGCVATGPYTGSGTPCALVLATGSNPETRLYVQGTTYAPKAALDITLNQVSEQVFRFGLVARSVRISITGSSTFTDAVIAVPDYSSAYAATVPMRAHLQVYTCPTASCTAPPVPAPPGWVPPAGGGWTRRLSSSVRVTDALYPPTAGDRQVAVETWSHRR